ncbi:MAG: S8 family serine peptidase, partial [Oscillospiraceae bacterium]
MKKAIMTTFLILVLIFFKVPALAVLSDDPYFYKQDNLQHIGYEAAWAQGLDGRGVRIAVIDSGVYTDHEDLVSTNILPGINLLDRSSNVEDTSGHGTFITGMLVAERNNGIGISGMVDKASVVPLKCFSSGRQTDSRYIVSAIYMAVDEYSCDVINLSLGISENIPALSEAVDYAVDKGVIIIASVGNTGGTSLMYPAAYDNVIGVGSVTLTDTSSYFSQRNTSVFVVAPGEKIISMGTDFKDSYMEGSGTSFSAVHVTALAAIAKQYNRSIDCDAFKELLKDSTVDLGTEGYDTT